MTYQNRNRNRELMPWVTAVIGGGDGVLRQHDGVCVLAVREGSGAVPAAGLGLDPSLQNPYMAIHPPMLYLGYVACAIPFAFAMAALITRPH